MEVELPGGSAACVLRRKLELNWLPWERNTLLDRSLPCMDKLPAALSGQSCSFYTVLLQDQVMATSNLLPLATYSTLIKFVLAV